MSLRSFALPDLGEGLEDAEVVRWLVSEGDEVELNQPIVEVDTEKAVVEIPSPYAGKVAQLHASVGEVVAVGATLITFEVPTETGSSVPNGDRSVLVGYGPSGPDRVGEKRPARRRHLTARAAGVVSRPSTSRAAPVVRKLAAELGIDLDKIAGTGPGGRISREDVLAAAATREGPAEAKAEGPEQRIAVRGVRRLVAEKMTRSVREIPHVTTFLTADATALLDAARKSRDKSGAGKVTALAVVGRTLVEVCKKHPKLNASWDEPSREIVLKGFYHLGIATDTDRGLVVTVVRNAGEMSIGELAAEIGRLSAAARDGSAKPDEVRGSTITISNVGTFHAEFGTPIINWPEAAILALGEILERPAAVGGKVVVRPEVTLSLSFDHRVMDGAEAGRALFDLKQLLEDAEALGDLVGSPTGN